MLHLDPEVQPTAVVVPTDRRRHVITETDEVRTALAAAAARWPNMPPNGLRRRLIAEGHAALRDSAAAERVAVERTSGALTGIYRPDELAALRAEWPA